MDFSNWSAEAMVSQIREFLSFFGDNPWVQALVLILASLILAKVTDIFITRGLLRLTKKTTSNIDDELIRLLHRPIFVTVLLVGLDFSLLLVTVNESIRDFAGNLIATLIILLWVVFGVRASTLFLGWLTRDVQRITVIQPATRPLFETASKLVLIALAIYFILVAWGVDPVGWLATAGIAAVAVGLAAQETLGNLFAGISIMADAPYKIGDYIVLAGEERGKVTRIGLRSTRILTRDDLEINIPNAVIARSKITNESSGRWVKQRLRIPVGVAYGSDPDEVIHLLVEATNAQKGICDHPAAWVKFSGFGASSLDFEIRCWIDDPAMRGRVISAVNRAVYRALDEAKIEIPFPKRDLYIKELPEGFLRSVKRPE